MNQVSEHIGVPTKEINLTPKQIERFWKKVEKGDGCWNWKGRKCKSGYGMVSLTTGQEKALSRKAHRVAYTLAKGPIKPGEFILHSCDNKACCNPDHLRVGTNDDNVRDKLERNRLCKGTKINMEIANEIRRRVFNGESKGSLAREFKIAPPTIRAICKFETWVDHRLWRL